MTTAALAVHTLGGLKVLRHGERLSLPTSRKTRALLGYLVATRRPHSRQSLCDLFWEGPIDPRADLRWSLSKLRPLLATKGASHLRADRDEVAFEASATEVDLIALESLAASGLGAAAADHLRTVLEASRGEFLEGLELPDCHRFQQWLLGERERVRSLRTAALAALVERLAAEPEEALRWAREWLQANPLDEAAHRRVIELLALLGRPDEALHQYESCRHVLRDELGAIPSEDVERARRGVYRRQAPAAVTGGVAAPSRPAGAPLVGRETETAALCRWLAAALDEHVAAPLVLVSGEPGIGKTRLLAELAAMARGRGLRVLAGRAFEAEMVRPYGAWIDCLRAVDRATVPAELQADLAPLLPELASSGAGGGDRARLFDALARLLADAASPTLVVLDDVQWFDEASSALLHFLARGEGGRELLLACSARSGELQENAAVSAAVHSLVAAGRVVQLTLGPLSREETAALVCGLGSTVAAERVFATSLGNPLFALEVARSLAGTADAATASLDGILDHRLQALGSDARELVPWAAAVGRSFAAALLVAATDLPAARVLRGFDELERRGIIVVGAGDGDRDGDSEASYDFAHDLVRGAAYRQLSAPRQRLVHLQLARAMAGEDDADGALAGEIAHHAAIGGDSLLAARSYLAAGERCLRIFAAAEGVELASRGLAHARRLRRDESIALQLALHGIVVYSGLRPALPEALIDELTRLGLEAERVGLEGETALAFHLVAMLHHKEGHWSDAGDISLRAAAASRGAEAAVQIATIGNTGRCLAMLGRDIYRAQALLEEASEMARRVRLRNSEIPLGLGFVHAHLGDYPRAVDCLEEAVAMAHAEQDHWREWVGLCRLVALELDRDRPQAALGRQPEAAEVASRLGEGSEAAFAAALEAVARLCCGEQAAVVDFERATATLRAIDTKGDLAYTLIIAARHHLAAGELERAESQAGEALALARTVGRGSEAAAAAAVLARVAGARGDRAAALAQLAPLREQAARAGELSALARALVIDAVAHVEVAKSNSTKTSVTKRSATKRTRST